MLLFRLWWNYFSQQILTECLSESGTILSTRRWVGKWDALCSCCIFTLMKMMITWCHTSVFSYPLALVKNTTTSLEINFQTYKSWKTFQGEHMIGELGTRFSYCPASSSSIEAGRPFIHWTLTPSLGNCTVSSGYHVYRGGAHIYFLAHISSLD